jgi:hypothetical protein
MRFNYKERCNHTILWFLLSELQQYKLENEQSIKTVNQLRWTETVRFFSFTDTGRQFVYHHVSASQFTL